MICETYLNFFKNQSLTGWSREQRSEQSGHAESSQSLAQRPLVFKLSLPLPTSQGLQVILQAMRSSGDPGPNRVPTLTSI